MGVNSILKDKEELIQKTGAEEYKEISGSISNIQRFSLHDGPGIRTLVFMQGCPLQCKWCCNPEGRKNYPQLRYIAAKCSYGIKCDAPCARVCPNNAVTVTSSRKLKMDWALCDSCGKCAEVCLYGARTMLGSKMTVDEVLAEIGQDRSFYNRSGGGMTIGGGEPLLHFEFTLELLKACKEWFLHTAMETCGHAPWKHLKKVSEYLDLMYYDIKHMNPERHRELTGVSNDLILRNAQRVLSGGVKCEVIVRTEVVPGCNDREDDIRAIARFVADSGGEKMELLPYHSLGSSKYNQLGMAYGLSEIKPPTEGKMRKLRGIVESFGLREMTGIY
jgi:pyruvate formate lyase activating enzyme